MDSYSAFYDNSGSGSGDTGLAGSLAEADIGAVFVAGLATDYCVGSTALDALNEGLGATVLAGGASAGVAEDTVKAMKARVLAEGGMVVNDLSIAAASSATQSSVLLCIFALSTSYFG